MDVIGWEFMTEAHPVPIQVENYGIAEEDVNIVQSLGITEGDIDIVERFDVSRDMAVAALFEAKGDIINAVMVMNFQLI